MPSLHYNSTFPNIYNNYKQYSPRRRRWARSWWRWSRRSCPPAPSTAAARAPSSPARSRPPPPPPAPPLSLLRARACVRACVGAPPTPLRPPAVRASACTADADRPPSRAGGGGARRLQLPRALAGQSWPPPSQTRIFSDTCPYLFMVPRRRRGSTPTAPPSPSSATGAPPPPDPPPSAPPSGRSL